MDKINETSWSMTASGGVFLYTVMSAPDQDGNKEVIYRGPCKATARLITMSPDLLAALQTIVYIADTVPEMSRYKGQLVRARDIIDQATA